METVLLYSPGQPASGCALAAEAPSQLVERDMVFSFQFRPREFERRSYRSATATDDCYLDWLCAAQSLAPVNRRASAMLTEVILRVNTARELHFLPNALEMLRSPVIGGAVNVTNRLEPRARALTAKPGWPITSSNV
jgi:hypothetical protein